VILAAVITLATAVAHARAVDTYTVTGTVVRAFSDGDGRRDVHRTVIAAAVRRSAMAFAGLRVTRSGERTVVRATLLRTVRSGPTEVTGALVVVIAHTVARALTQATALGAVRAGPLLVTNTFEVFVARALTRTVVQTLALTAVQTQIPRLTHALEVIIACTMAAALIRADALVARCALPTGLTHALLQGLITRAVAAFVGHTGECCVGTTRHFAVTAFEAQVTHALEVQARAMTIALVTALYVLAGRANETGLTHAHRLTRDRVQRARAVTTTVIEFRAQ